VALVDYFSTLHGRKYNKRIEGIDDDARQAILAHQWPGNIRELNHAVERAVLMSRDGRITLRALGIEPTQDKAPSIDAMSLEDASRILMQKALERCDGNVSKAAEQLGMSRATFYRRMKSQEP
jgi:transcriptional regulator of acetoin/glycerol metabolism